ncbi:MAG: hypothetical protein J1E34_07315 [Oscillospiraceae bacterium]|nr:hypothetical protein [Oscillospiraceae bacterium]
MKLTDKEVSDLIKASALNNSDIYFTLSKMPSGDEIKEFSRELDCKILVLTPRNSFTKTSETVIYSDIGAALNENFTDFLISENISEILLPFYECADSLEYGYRAAYANIAEIRASTGKQFHITGISPNITTGEKIFSLLGSDKYIQAGIENETVFKGIKTASDKSKYHYTAAECEKSPFDKSIVLFSTRRQAEEFSLFMYKRRTPFTIVHGGIDKIKINEALKSFLSGEVNILLATKFIIPAYSLLCSDKLIYCGLPYSRSHALRCLSLSKNGKMDCIFSEDDVILTEKLILSFSKELGTYEPDYIKNRNNMFNDFLDQLQY